MPTAKQIAKLEKHIAKSFTYNENLSIIELLEVNENYVDNLLRENLDKICGLTANEYGEVDFKEQSLRTLKSIVEVLDSDPKIYFQMKDAREKMEKSKESCRKSHELLQRIELGILDVKTPEEEVDARVSSIKESYIDIYNSDERFKMTPDVLDACLFNASANILLKDKGCVKVYQQILANQVRRQEDPFFAGIANAFEEKIRVSGVWSIFKKAKQGNVLPKERYPELATSLGLSADKLPQNVAA